MKFFLTAFVSILYFFELFFQQNFPVFTYNDTSFIVGATMTRRNIFFNDDCQTQLAASSRKPLDSLYKFLFKNSVLKIEVGVHTGKPCKKCGVCQNPTQNGADSIKNYLVRKGIDKKRVISMGYGQTLPVITNIADSKAQRANARVVYKITYNKF